MTEIKHTGRVELALTLLELFTCVNEITLLRIIKVADDCALSKFDLSTTAHFAISDL